MMTQLTNTISSHGPKFNLTNTKLIIAGSKYELVTYEKPIFYNISAELRKERQHGLRKQMHDGKIKKVKSKSNIKRSMDNLRRKINANFNSWDTAFVTLTFAEDITDINIGNQYFSRFTNRLRPYYSGIKYIACPERHEERLNVLHYHMLYRLREGGFIPANLEVVRAWLRKGLLPEDYNPNNNLANLWRHGFVDARRLRAADLGLTFSRYISKINNELNVFNKKAYIIYSQP